MMKRIFFILMFMVTCLSAGAQNCRDIVLPRFHNDTARFEQCPAMKVDFWCFYSRLSFYESDTIPTGAATANIEVVADVFTGEHLSPNYIVDLTTLSFFRYNFGDIQAAYYDGAEKEVCFSTPASAHPYLVLRTRMYANEHAERAVRDLYRW